MAIKDTDRKARANYKKKITTIRMELYGTDEDIREHIERIKEDGISVQGYIKDLIRADMKRKRHEPLVDRATYTRVQEKLKEQTETTPAPLPLGYKIQDGKIVIDEEEAEIVNRAAEEMARAGRLSAETEKRIRKLMEKRHEQNQEVVMGETMARADLEKAALSDDLKRFKEKLDEKRMEELKKRHFVSEEKRKEFQDRLDAGAKPADLFKPTRQKKTDQ